ncbi:MAG: triple tyrosine motif-containing protein [Bacteroidota bacterium]
MKLVTSILLIFILAHTNVYAQPQQYLFSYLGMKDGLQEEAIMTVQQDSIGYIWIASQNALQRYDGKRLLNFPHRENDPTSLPSGGISGMIIDKQNRLWILSGSGIVGFLDVKTFAFHRMAIRHPNADFAKTRPVLHIDKDGNILLLFPGRGFLTFNEQAGEFAGRFNLFSLPQNWRLLYFWQDADRNYWIGAHEGLMKYNPRNKKISYAGHNEENDPVIEHFAEMRTVGFAYVDQSKRFWLSAWPNQRLVIKSFHPGTGEDKEWQSDILKTLKGIYYEMHGVTELQDGSLWMAGYNILARVNNKSGTIEPVQNNAAGEYSIRYDEIFKLYEDREHNVWVCTNKGLFRFNPSSQLFRAVKNVKPGSDSAYTNDVNDLLQAPNGEILVSTWGEGVFAYDNQFNAVRSKILPPAAQKTGLMWCITRRQNGDIWQGGQDGHVYIHEAATNVSTHIDPATFEKSTVRQVEEDAEGNMWLGTQRGYLYKWMDSTKQFVLLHKFHGIVSRIYHDRENHMWVCTDQDGVYRLDPTGNIVETYTATSGKGKSLRINGAADILQYNDTLMVIVSDGLNVLNTRTKTFKYFTVENGLPSANILGLVKDREGYLWMSSSVGILSYHPFRKKMSTYNAADGVHTNSYNVAATALLNDGRIAFGTNHDLLVFDPRVVTVADFVPPKVQITGFALMNKPLSVDSLSKLSRIVLKDHEHSISVQLSTLNYQNLYDIYYMMEGMDKDWVSSGKSQEANFNYLPPGKYTFKTGSRDSEGNIREVTTLHIYIKPPFYFTWWFIGLLVFAGIVLLYWFDKFRVGRIRETERVRTRIATSLTKDMSTTLGNINLLSEMAKLKVDKDIERTKDYISQISNSSNRMIEVMDDMIWSINPENDELQYTITRMRKYAAQVQSKYDMEITFDVGEKVRELKLHMDKRHELFQIYKEALLNAGMHARSPFAQVSILCEKSLLKLKVTDNGRGFDTEEVSFGRGLNEMRKKALLLKADLEIVSEMNNGTTVSLEMKV